MYSGCVNQYFNLGTMDRSIIIIIIAVLGALLGVAMAQDMSGSGE